MPQQINVDNNSKDNFYYRRLTRLGKLWAEALLQRGDKVVATARDLNSLGERADELVINYNY